MRPKGYSNRHAKKTFHPPPQLESSRTCLSFVGRSLPSCGKGFQGLSGGEFRPVYKMRDRANKYRNISMLEVRDPGIHGTLWNPTCKLFAGVLAIGKLRES
jgi:hypothetical protein